MFAKKQLPKVLDWLFPSFTEMNIFVMFSIIVALIFTNPDARYGFTHPGEGQNLALVMFVPIFLLLFTLVIIIKGKIDNATKVFLVTIYYAFIAILSGISLAHHAGSINHLSPFKLANLFLIGFMFITAIIRFAFVWFLSDDKASGNDKFIAANLKDDQYRYSSFVIVAVITAAIVVGLEQMYASTATVAILAFGYINILLSAVDHRILKPYIIQER